MKLPISYKIKILLIFLGIFCNLTASDFIETHLFRPLLEKWRNKEITEQEEPEKTELHLFEKEQADFVKNFIQESRILHLKKIESEVNSLIQETFLYMKDVYVYKTVHSIFNILHHACENLYKTDTTDSEYIRLLYIRYSTYYLLLYTFFVPLHLKSYTNLQSKPSFPQREMILDLTSTYDGETMIEAFTLFARLLEMEIFEAEVLHKDVRRYFKKLHDGFEKIVNEPREERDDKLKINHATLLFEKKNPPVAPSTSYKIALPLLIGAEAGGIALLASEYKNKKKSFPVSKKQIMGILLCTGGAIGLAYSLI